jgi:hypothetical protein
MFITVFSTAHSQLLSCATWIRSTPSLRSILITSFYIRSCLPSSHYSFGLRLKFCYNSSVRATCPAYLILLHLITLKYVAKCIHYDVSCYFWFLHSLPTSSPPPHPRSTYCPQLTVQFINLVGYVTSRFTIHLWSVRFCVHQADVREEEDSCNTVAAWCSFRPF